MIHSLRSWMVVAVICVGVAGATGQQRATGYRLPPAHVDDSGLLLGLYLPDGASWDNPKWYADEDQWVPNVSPEPEGKYMTLWIARTNGAVKVRATEGLFVSRKNGFWRVGTHFVAGNPAIASSFEERIWAVPAGDQVPVATPDEDISGRSVRLITYVGPEYFAYVSHSQSGWEYFHPRVASLDEPDKDLPIGEVLGPSVGRAYQRLAKSMSHSEGAQDMCDCCDGYPDEWGIWHVGDSWQVNARFHHGLSSTCAQDTEDRVVAAAAPRRMFPSGSLKRSWDDVRKEAAAALKFDEGSIRHIFVSPDKDLAVALTTKGLAILTIRDSHIRSLLMLQPISTACTPVMEQWATGQFVSKWGAAMKKQAPETVPH